MNREVRVLISIVLATPAFLLFPLALWLRVRSDQLAKTPAALQTIRQNEELDNHYVPDDELLSPIGVQMRRHGNRFMTLGVVLVVLALLNHLTS
jgi:hypothetical protein